MILIALALASARPAHAGKDKDIALTAIGTYETGLFAAGGAEITAYDPGSQRLFVVNLADSAIDILDLSDPSAPAWIGAIDVSGLGVAANSVAVHGGLVAVAIEAYVQQDPGVAAFYDVDGGLLGAAEVGALPDMITFSPDGRYALTANEGQPSDDYAVDPAGSVTIIDLAGGAAGLGPDDVITADFSAFNGADLDPSVRVYGPGASAAQDFEPEYIAVDHTSRTAWVTLQENNAVAVIDLAAGEVIDVVGLGYKDHSRAGSGLDASDRDSRINIANWPVYGMYLPDAIAALHDGSRTWLLIANEGDARAYSAFNEETRVGSVTLDPSAFPAASSLRANANLGRLRITNTQGDADGDGDYDALYAFGARSFSVLDEAGGLVYDSGDDLESITAALIPADFNANNDDNGSFDSRSDDKGPEPEGLALGKAFGRDYAFVGLERVGGVAVFDLSDPAAPRFVTYATDRDFSGDAEAGTAGGLGPEGLLFIPADDSPTGAPLLVVSNEVSGSVTVFEISKD